MPIYAYRCTTCGHAKDVLQKMSDPLLTECPQCATPTFVKQVTAAGFQLKGSGWYVTDFKGDNKPAAGASSDKAESADAPQSDGAKPDVAAAASPAASPTTPAAAPKTATAATASASTASTPAVTPPPKSSS
jgi:putative FmdB family regulatory protein